MSSLQWICWLHIASTHNLLRGLIPLQCGRAFPVKQQEGELFLGHRKCTLQYSFWGDLLLWLLLSTIIIIIIIIFFGLIYSASISTRRARSIDKPRSFFLARWMTKARSSYLTFTNSRNVASDPSSSLSIPVWTTRWQKLVIIRS